MQTYLSKLYPHPSPRQKLTTPTTPARTGLSKVQILTWNVGNMRRPALVTIISVPSWWNSSQSGLASSAAPAPMRARCSGLFASSPVVVPPLLFAVSSLRRLLLLSLLPSLVVVARQLSRGDERPLLQLLLLSAMWLGDDDDGFLDVVPAVCRQAVTRVRQGWDIC